MHSEDETAAPQAARDNQTEDPAADSGADAASDDVPELSIEDAVAPLETQTEDDPATALSPSVRRLVRQYDLDITGIHGTGPAGRIKVGDVIALLGGRGEAPPARSSDSARTIRVAENGIDDRPRATPYRSAASSAPAPAVVPAAAAAVAATTIFECDLSRVLAHRKQRSEQKADVALTSYYLLACGEALRLAPEAAPNGTALGVVLSAADGQTHTMLVEIEESALESINDRLLAFDRALRSRDASTSVARAALVLYHHGLAGSLIATPTPIAEGHAASIGLGRVRKQIVLRTIDGEDVPRAAATAYVTLSFLPDRLDLQRANRFLAHFVRVLEQWPE